MSKRYRLSHLLKSIAFVLISLVTIWGCEDDDSGGNDAQIIGTLEYGNQTLTFEDGVIFDYGEETPGFRNFDFFLTEVEEDFDTESEVVNSEYLLYFWMESEGAASFDEGLFTYDDEGPTPETSFIFDANLSLDPNNFDDLGDFAESGTIDVSISGDTYTLDVDLQMTSGNSLSGTIEYQFPIIDASEESMPKQSKQKRYRFSISNGRK